MVSHIYKFNSEWHGQTTPSWEQNEAGPGCIFSNFCWQANPQLWHRVFKLPSLPINPKIEGIESYQEWPSHHTSLSTLRSKGLSRTKMKWWAIYTFLPVNAIVRLPHPGSGYNQARKRFQHPLLTSKLATMT